MIVEFKDYLKTLGVADYYYIGKIENIKEKVLGIYSAYTNPRRIESVGKNGSYGAYGVRLLLHWNKNAKESEASALNLFEKIRYIQDTDMSHTEITDTGDSSEEVVTTTVHVQYIDWDYDEPNFIGTDENNVYEYVISGTIYYRKEQ